MRVVTWIFVVLLFISSIRSGIAAKDVFEISQTTDSAIHEIEGLLFALISVVQASAVTIALAILTRREPERRREPDAPKPVNPKFANEAPPKDTRMNVASMPRSA